jgi:hypothetical protein
MVGYRDRLQTLVQRSFYNLFGGDILIAVAKGARRMNMQVNLAQNGIVFCRQFPPCISFRK